MEHDWGEHWLVVQIYTIRKWHLSCLSKKDPVAKYYT